MPVRELGPNWPTKVRLKSGHSACVVWVQPRSSRHTSCISHFTYIRFASPLYKCTCINFIFTTFITLISPTSHLHLSSSLPYNIMRCLFHFTLLHRIKLCSCILYTAERHHLFLSKTCITLVKTVSYLIQRETEFLHLFYTLMNCCTWRCLHVMSLFRWQCFISVHGFWNMKDNWNTNSFLRLLFIRLSYCFG